MFESQGLNAEKKKKITSWYYYLAHMHVNFQIRLSAQKSHIVQYIMVECLVLLKV